jgi:quaternary ammonium compound-resistance protein SugE
MSWLLLLIAGLLEVVWAIGLKYTEGFTRLWPSVGTGAAMVASVVLLGLAMRTLPVGTAYAVWTGIGAVGTVILGIVLFAEPATAARLGCVALIVAGIARRQRECRPHGPPCTQRRSGCIRARVAPQVTASASSAPRSAAISLNCSSAAWRSSTISCAITSGGGRLSLSASESSFSQNTSRLALSRAISSS